MEFLQQRKEYLAQIEAQTKISTQQQLVLKQDQDDEMEDEKETSPGGVEETEVRETSSLSYNLADQVITDVRPILEFLQCSICMSTAEQPKVIKHCLHFFCKECIETFVKKYHRSCPLCKTEMRTHRELREYDKMKHIIAFLKPLIEQACEQDDKEAAEIRQRQLIEQKAMSELRDQQTQIKSTEGLGSKRRRNLELEEEKLEIQAVERETFACQDQERIRRKVEKLRQIQNIQQKKLKQMIKPQQILTEGQKLEQQYSKAYANAKNSSYQSQYLWRQDPACLDLQVRCVFEENLQTMIFPKVKEFLFRVNRNSPIEVAAKALARKNGPGHNWKDYSFSHINNTNDKETRYSDLATRFDLITSPNEELVLFYRVDKMIQYQYA